MGISSNVNVFKNLITNLFCKKENTHTVIKTSSGTGKVSQKTIVQQPQRSFGYNLTNQATPKQVSAKKVQTTPIIQIPVQKAIKQKSLTKSKSIIQEEVILEACKEYPEIEYMPSIEKMKAEKKDD